MRKFVLFFCFTRNFSGINNYLVYKNIWKKYEK